MVKHECVEFNSTVSKKKKMRERKWKKKNLIQ